MSIVQANREPLRNAFFVWTRLLFLPPTSPGDAVSFVVLCCPSVARSICNSVHLHASRVVTTEAGRIKLDKQALLGHSISGEDPKVRVTVGRKGFFWFRFKENTIPLVEVSGFDYAPALEVVCQMCATVFGQCGVATLPAPASPSSRLIGLLSAHYGAAGGVEVATRPATAATPTGVAATAAATAAASTTATAAAAAPV